MAYGKIVADQIQHSSEGTVGTQYVVSGSAKAWVHFNGVGTVATRDSFNMSSVTDRGTGTYTTSATNAMASADYAWTSNASNQGTVYGAYCIEGDNTGTKNFNGRTSADVRIATGGNGGWDDNLSISSVYHGDLA
jgi:hypothetical protein